MFTRSAAGAGADHYEAASYVGDPTSPALTLELEVARQSKLAWIGYVDRAVARVIVHAAGRADYGIALADVGDPLLVQHILREQGEFPFAILGTKTNEQVEHFTATIIIIDPVGIEAGPVREQPTQERRNTVHRETDFRVGGQAEIRRLADAAVAGAEADIARPRNGRRSVPVRAASSSEVVARQQGVAITGASIRTSLKR